MSILSTIQLSYTERKIPIRTRKEEIFTFHYSNAKVQQNILVNTMAIKLRSKKGFALQEFF